MHAVSPFDLNNWNSLFWIVHPGGRAILEEAKLKLNLNEDKLGASGHVLTEYGNMTSTCLCLVRHGRAR